MQALGLNSEKHCLYTKIIFSFYGWV